MQFKMLVSQTLGSPSMFLELRTIFITLPRLEQICSWIARSIAGSKLGFRLFLLQKSLARSLVFESWKILISSVIFFDTSIDIISRGFCLVDFEGLFVELGLGALVGRFWALELGLNAFFRWVFGVGCLVSLSPSRLSQNVLSLRLVFE